VSETAIGATAMKLALLRAAVLQSVKLLNHQRRAQIESGTCASRRSGNGQHEPFMIAADGGLYNADIFGGPVFQCRHQKSYLKTAVILC
jgi:hypothetical protein